MIFDCGDSMYLVTCEIFQRRQSYHILVITDWKRVYCLDLLGGGGCPNTSGPILLGNAFLQARDHGGNEIAASLSRIFT